MEWVGMCVLCVRLGGFSEQRESGAKPVYSTLTLCDPCCITRESGGAWFAPTLLVLVLVLLRNVARDRLL